MLLLIAKIIAVLILVSFLVTFLINGFIWFRIYEMDKKMRKHWEHFDE